MTSTKPECCGFELLWDVQLPVTSLDKELIIHANEGLTVYRILFEDADKKSCANVGESRRGLGHRLKEHIGNDDPTYLPQARMRAALAKGNQLSVETLSKAKSTFKRGDVTRPVDLDDEDERLLIEALEQMRLRDCEIDVVNSRKKPRHERAPWGTKSGRAKK